MVPGPTSAAHRARHRVRPEAEPRANTTNVPKIRKKSSSGGPRAADHVPVPRRGGRREIRESTSVAVGGPFVELQTTGKLGPWSGGGRRRENRPLPTADHPKGRPGVVV